MARLALTPTALTKATALNITDGLVSLGANTGVSFVNTGNVFLIVSLGATATTITENIGLTVQGQSVTAPTSAPPTNKISILGPWPSQFNQTDGSNNLFLDFSSQTAVTVMLCQMVGVS